MKRVLFIAYHFPPLAGGGTFRSLKFVKYLPEFGWLPTVITTNTKNYWAYDESLLSEIPDNVKVIRAPEIDPFYLQIILSKLGLGKLYKFLKDKFFIPDEKIGWIPWAYYLAKKELKLSKHDLIYSTSPTACSHIIAYKLKKNLRIPWVCDFRDRWTLHPHYQYTKVNRGRYERFLENKFLKYSSNRITAFMGISKDWQENFPGIKRKKINIIYNGYDENDIGDNDLCNSRKYFKILYTGSFYSNYKPTNFLIALKDLISVNKELAQKIRVKFIGNIDNKIKKEIFQYYSESVIKNFLPPSKLKMEMLRSSVLLVIMPNDTQLPAKIFPYLVSNKPILAIIPESEAKNILQQSGLGFFARPDDVKDIKKQILNLYNLWKADRLRPNSNIEYINQFHRKNLTKQLVEIFNSLI